MKFNEAQIKREAWGQLSILEDGREGYYIFLEGILQEMDPKDSFILRREIRTIPLLFPVLQDNLVSLEFLLKRDFSDHVINRKFITFEHEAVNYYVNKYPSIRYIPVKEVAATSEELGANPFELFEELYFLNNWFPILG